MNDVEIKFIRGVLERFGLACWDIGRGAGLEMRDKPSEQDLAEIRQAALDAVHSHVVED